MGFDKNVGRLSIWATVCKTVRLVLSDRRLSVCLSCPVCNVGVLSPQGWTDQNETWYECRPRPWPHCIRWGPRSPTPKGTQPPIFGPYGQTARWIKMPLGRKVGLNPSDIVLDGDKAPLPQKGAEPPVFGSCLVWPNGCMDQDATAQATLCSMWTQRPLPEKRGTAPPFFGPCLLWPNGWMDQDASWYGGRPRPRGLLDRDPASLSKKGKPPNFRPMFIVGKRLDGSRWHLA